MCDVLHQHGFAGAGRRDDQCALAFAYRGYDIDDARGEILAGRILELETKALIRKQRRQVVEIDLVLDFSGSSKFSVLTFSSAK
jgi:hypothetical protein